MPLDPSIALSYRPPDFLGELAKQAQLRQADQQNQLGQQQLQEGKLQLQERQRGIQQDEQARALYKSQPGQMPSEDQIISIYGPLKAAPILKSLNDAKQAKATLDKTKGEIADHEADYFGGLAAAVKASGNDPQALDFALKQAEQNGYGQHVQQIKQVLSQNPNALPQLLEQTIQASPTQRKVMAEEGQAAARKQASATGAAKEGREAGQQQFQNAISDLAANPPKTALEYRQRISALPTEQAMRIMEAAPIGQYDPATTPAMLRKLGMNPEQQTQADQAAANATQTAAHNKIEEQQGAQRIAMEGQNVELRNKEYQQKYGDVLGSLSPDQLAVATKLAHGEMSPAQLSRYPDKEKLTAAAIRINPAWTQATYDTNQSFTNPEKGQAKNLGTISRIVGHIGRFEENSKDIGLAPGFAMGMKLTGPQSKLSEDSHAIAGELEKLVSGGVGSMEQTRAWQKALSSPFPSARQQAVDEISQLIGSQYEGMNQTFKAGTGADLPIEKYVSPAGREWMKSKKINVAGATAPATASGGTVSVTDPNGGVHTFRSQADADKFKGLAGIK